MARTGRRFPNLQRTRVALLPAGGPVALAGTTNGVSTMSGDWIIARALAATSAGVSSMTGDLTVTSPAALLQDLVFMHRIPMGAGLT